MNQTEKIAHEYIAKLEAEVKRQDELLFQVLEALDDDGGARCMTVARYLRKALEDNDEG